MSGQPGQSARRRELLRSLVRYPLVGALGLLGARLVMRQPGQGPLQAGQECVSRGVCRGCRRLSQCGLPQGLMARSDRDRAKPYERTF